ncbi:MAG: hypothetical protein PF505_03385 [Vallitaleaceae bacterium]|nr:hypothetical protein [Vallitaleaceae bacterium]
MNFLVKKAKIKHAKFDPTIVVDIDSDIEVEATGSVPKSIHIDDFSVQLILIGVVYMLTFGFLSGFEWLAVKFFGNFGTTVARLFWGFNFMFGTLFALMVRAILDKFRSKQILKVNYADNYLLQKISSASFDIMIAAALTAISIKALKAYLVPVLVITTVGGVATMLFVFFYVKRIYKEYVLEHMVALYGTWTGNVTTGIALLKEVDPYSKSNVIEHIVLGSGYAVFFGIPLMVILAVPELGYAQGKPFYYILTLIIFALYSVLMNIGIFRHKIFKKKA